MTVAKPADPALLAHQYGRLRARMLDAVGSYEGAKQTFADVTRSYVDGLNGRALVIAEAMAANDSRRQKAIADAAWYREEAAMYAAVCTALHPHIGGAPS